MYKLSINRPISVSTFINFLRTLYKAHEKATIRPTQGTLLKFLSRIKIATQTRKIEILIMFLGLAL